MTEEELTVFCFRVNGYRDEYHGNYHPASLYIRNVENPYSYHGDDEAREMMNEAFNSLPKEPEEYSREDAGSGGWIRFDYEKLVSGENKEPIMLTDND